MDIILLIMIMIMLLTTLLISFMSIARPSTFTVLKQLPRILEKRVLNQHVKQGKPQIGLVLLVQVRKTPSLQGWKIVRPGEGQNQFRNRTSEWDQNMRGQD